MDDLLYRAADGIAFVTFNRPASRNALTFAMYEELAEICQRLDADRTIKALVLTGAGETAFAAGTDISQFRTFATAQDALDYEARIERVLDAVERCCVPTIAAIAGACTGGGAGIAAACDLRIAAPNVRIGFPIARTLGNCLSPANYARLAALIGAARVKDIIFRARLVEAQEALAIGFVTELTLDYGGLLPRAEAVARQVASHAPLTLQVTKEALRRLRPKLDASEDRDLILKCYLSRDFREGMDAFLNKRTPEWQGE
jgi:enoyl-CoA hydratase